MSHVRFEYPNQLTKRAPATLAQVRAFEARWGVTLPDDYRAFLMSTNGGSPEPDVFDYTHDGRALEDAVECFFQLHDDRTHVYHVDTGTAFVRRTRPDLVGAVSIAKNRAGDDLVLLDGRVVFVYHDLLGPPGEIAPSFTALLASLR